MEIVRVSDPILLPLAPTMAGTIANYLQLKAQQVRGHLSHNYDNIATELLPARFWDWQSERSIQPVTTLQYQYVSTIAHRLAAKSSLNPLKICEYLQSSVLTEIPTDLAGLELSCWYNDAGYIYFEVADTSIERWLEYIHYIPLNRQLHTDRAVCDPTLAIYAHARCCAILTLADRERVVAIAPDWQMSSADWRTCKSLAISSHHQPDRLPAQLTSIYDRPAERQLIKTLMTVLDAIYSPSALGVSPDRSTQQMRAPNWARLTIDLAQSWLEFYRSCQIFGDIKRQNPRLAIARCGLTAIARRYLQVLLENYLGVSALVEL
jgi:hypothetical protein